jgi:hypothetical protein
MREKSLVYLKKLEKWNGDRENLNRTALDALSVLTLLRHRLHSTPGCLWCGAAAWQSNRNMLGTFAETMLHAASLPGLELDCYLRALPEGNTEKDRKTCVELEQKINQKIEDYLEIIDWYYGTKFKPTGFARRRFIRNRSVKK